MNQPDTPLKDRFLFLVVYPLLAIATVHMGNDTPLRIALLLPSYYTDILFALGIAYLFGFYIRKVSTQLNHQWPWQLHLRQRLLLQVLLGVGVPVVFVGICEWIYLRWLQIPLSQSSIFYYELPLSAIFFSFINGVYYFLQTHTSSQPSISETNSPVSYPETYVVTSGFTTKPVAMADIACFYVQDKAVYLLTTTSQKYLIKESLEEIAQKLDPELFFKLNRWVLAHRKSIQHAEHTSTRKLRIQLAPPIEDEIFVSKERATSFLAWLEK